MLLHYVKILSAITTWSVAITLTTETKPGHWGLAIFVATIACVPTFWLMVDAAANAVCRVMKEAVREERKHTEELVLAVACEFAQAELPRLEARRRGGV